MFQCKSTTTPFLNPEEKTSKNGIVKTEHPLTSMLMLSEIKSTQIWLFGL